MERSEGTEDVLEGGSSLAATVVGSLPETVEKIVGFLPQPSLEECRLVNSIWRDASTQKFAQMSKINIGDFDDMGEFQRTFSHPAAPKVFRAFKFYQDYFKDDAEYCSSWTDCYINHSKNITSVECELKLQYLDNFFELIHGMDNLTQVKLEIDGDLVEEEDFFVWRLLHWCPDRDPYGDGEIDGICIPTTSLVFPQVKDVSLEVSGDECRVPIFDFAEIITNAFPAVEILSLDLCSMYMEPVRILQAFSWKLEDRVGPPAVVDYKGSLETEEGENCLEEFSPLRFSHLRRLKTNVAALKERLGRQLEPHKDYLKRLELDFYMDNDHNAPMKSFAPGIFSELRYLEICLQKDEEVEELKPRRWNHELDLFTSPNVPKLEELRLTLDHRFRWSIKKEEEGFSNSIAEGLLILLGKGGPFQNVHSFHCRIIRFNEMDAIDVPGNILEIDQMFPNLKYFTSDDEINYNQKWEDVKAKLL